MPKCAMQRWRRSADGGGDHANPILRDFRDSSATGNESPAEIPPLPSARWRWTCHGIAEWLGIFSSIDMTKRCLVRYAAVAHAGPCRGRFTHFVPPPPTRAATGWCICGPCRPPSRSAETTIRPFRPPLRPPAPTASSDRLASPVPNHRLGATGGVPSGKETALPPPPPLRTGRESFPSSGSSRCEVPCERGRSTRELLARP